MDKTLPLSLSLAAISGLGPKTYVSLIQHFGDVEGVYRASKAHLQSTGLRPKIVSEILKGPQDGAFNRELAWANHKDQHLVAYGTDRYPLALGEIADPPPHLYVKGNLELLFAPQLAMVGSRNPTATGRETASQFAQALTRQDLIITSGLAAGIDYECHKGALTASGPTIAVAGTGLDRVYPANHRDLARSIAREGALVSEFPLGTAPASRNFPKRNRIISGLSLGVVVVEATIHSGSLITARMANEQGREVFAIPGSIHNPQSKGCHSLIKQGAKLVECTEDILCELSGIVAAPQPITAASKGPSTHNREENAHRGLLDFIGFEPTSIDTIVKRSGVCASEVSALITLLELDGHITSVPGGYMKTNR